MPVLSRTARASHRSGGGVPRYAGDRLCVMSYGAPGAGRDAGAFRAGRIRPRHDRISALGRSHRPRVLGMSQHPRRSRSGSAALQGAVRRAHPNVPRSEPELRGVPRRSRSARGSVRGSRMRRMSRRDGLGSGGAVRSRECALPADREARRPRLRRVSPRPDRRGRSGHACAIAGHDAGQRLASRGCDPLSAARVRTVLFMSSGRPRRRTGAPLRELSRHLGLESHPARPVRGRLRSHRHGLPPRRTARRCLVRLLSPGLSPRRLRGIGLGARVRRMSYEPGLGTFGVRRLQARRNGLRTHRRAPGRALSGLPRARDPGAGRCFRPGARSARRRAGLIGPRAQDPPGHADMCVVSRPIRPPCRSVRGHRVRVVPLHGVLHDRELRPFDHTVRPRRVARGGLVRGLSRTRVGRWRPRRHSIPPSGQLVPFMPRRISRAERGRRAPTDVAMIPGANRCRSRRVRRAMIYAPVTLVVMSTSGAVAQEARARDPGSTQRVSAESADPRYASPHGLLSTDLDCSSCHDAQSWTTDRLEFDHDPSGFRLAGRHASIRCAACHLDLRFDEPRIAEGDCSSCHADVHQGSLGDECASCHHTESFEARSDPAVHARTSFPLTGSHLLVHCESCHFDDRRPRFDALDTQCISCHETDFEGARNHVAEAYSIECLACHNTVAWFHRARTPPPFSRRR